MITMPRGAFSSSERTRSRGSGAGMWRGIGSQAGFDCGRGARIGGARRSRCGASLTPSLTGLAGLLVTGIPLSATRSASTEPILEQFPDHPSDACTFREENIQVADFIGSGSVGIGNEICHPARFTEVWVPRSDILATTRVLTDTENLA